MSFSYDGPALLCGTPPCKPVLKERCAKCEYLVEGSVAIEHRGSLRSSCDSLLARLGSDVEAANRGQVNPGAV